MWYDPKLFKYDFSAKLMVEGSVEDYQYLVGTNHFDDEDWLLYVTQIFYVRRSPVGEVILVSRAPVHKNGLISSRADSTPVRAKDFVRLAVDALEDEVEVNINSKSVGQIGKVNYTHWLFIVTIQPLLPYSISIAFCLSLSTLLKLL